MVGGGSIFRPKLVIRSGPGALFFRCLMISVTLWGDMVISGPDGRVGVLSWAYLYSLALRSGGGK